MSSESSQHDIGKPNKQEGSSSRLPATTPDDSKPTYNPTPLQSPDKPTMPSPSDDEIASTVSREEVFFSTGTGANSDGMDAPDASGESDDATVISKQPPLPTPNVTDTLTPKQLGQSLLGTELGHYHLERYIGSGGMGTVFQANDTMLGRTVAVKILSKNQSDADLHKRFQNEAQSAARLDHENIARVYYVGQDKGWNYIVFEYIEGENVRDLVSATGSFSLSEALNYTYQVADALEHAWERDVIHRDIKPSNLVITSQGKVKIVDMGLARLHQVETSQDDLTASGVTLGTFDYISPEQAKDPRTADVRSDLYSLGCTLYFMLSGTPPFPNGTVLQKLLSHSSDKRPDIRESRSDLPKEMTRLINRMLEPDPEKRFQRPCDLTTEILAIAQKVGVPIAHTASVSVPKRKTNRRWLTQAIPVILPAAILLMGLLIVNQVLPRPTSNWDPSQANFPFLPSASDEINREPTEENSDIAFPPVRDDGNLIQDENPSIDVENTNTADDDNQNSTLNEGEGDNGDSESNPEGSQTEQTENTVGDAIANNATDAGASEADSDASTTESKSIEDDSLLVKFIRVGATVAVADHETVDVSTLDAALTEASRYENLEAIRLSFNGEMFVSKPLAISGSHVRIEADAKMNPILLFSPMDFVHKAMIQVASKSLHFAGVHFYMMLPEQGSSQSSLFQVAPYAADMQTESQVLTFEDCSFTINNATLSRPMLSPVSIISLLAPGPSDVMDSKSNWAGPIIELNNCVARGETRLLYAENSLPFQLSWEQGLFASSKRMIEVGGSMAEYRGEVINVSLKNVTAVTDENLILVRSSTDLANQLQLILRFDACVLKVPTNMGLIEHDIQQEAGNLSNRLMFNGDDNIVEAGSTFWHLNSLQSETNLSSVLEQKFSLANKQDFGNWFRQSWESVHEVTWLPLDLGLKRPHEQLLSAYQLDLLIGRDTPFWKENPDLSIGFQPNLVPRFPLGLPQRNNPELLP